jgi:F420-non-reducing hydrogenase iron-sulfur subunit
LVETLSVTGPRTVTAFICANCSSPGRQPDPFGVTPAAPPLFEWPVPVREVLVSCTGRLQPEHVLKAFESGSDLVLTVSCEQDDCQYLQGSERWSRRADYVRAILDEIGLGSSRLMHFQLAGTAGAGAIRDAVLQTLESLGPNPLHLELPDDAAEEAYQQVETSEEENED